MTGVNGIDNIDILSLVKANENYTVEVRRHLHRHPELSRMEFETLKYIRSHLEKLGIPYVEVEDGGIFASIGDESRGKTVLLRADIDALLIQENPRNLARERDVLSEVEGVQHACGHDAHTAMLLTAGKILKEREGKIPGRVLLMFERGEEVGGNFRQLLYYLEDKNIHVDGGHAIHVRPGVPAGKIVVIPGPIMSAGCGFNVTITGRGGHGSRPDLANSPLDCFTSLYQSLKDIRLKHISPFDNFTFSVGTISYGNKGNVIPGELKFEGSARMVNEANVDRFFDEFDLLLDSITRAHHCGYRTERRFKGTPALNNPLMVKISQEAIRKYLGEDRLIARHEPLMASDSWARTGKFFPPVMIHLGVDNPELGCGADLHTSLFDLDESVLPLGVAATVGFALGFLKNTEDPCFIPFPGTVRDLLGEDKEGLNG
ncbi:MAG: amidohydrolase [Treponema sp.]|jgi:amidohydrolase|nr:amidohydrolase [Treponema sp.]